MAEIVLPDQVLGLLNGFTPIQRVLLATTGTLQSTLSAYFGAPVTVKLVRQEEEDSYSFSREVYLMCRDLAVCRAVSEITVVNEDVRRLIRGGRLGLGQILEVLGIRPAFSLSETGQEGDTFWRVYRLGGPGVAYRIREEFPIELYRG